MHHCTIIYFLWILCTLCLAVNMWRRCGKCAMDSLLNTGKVMKHTIRKLGQTGTTDIKTCGYLSHLSVSCDYEYPVELYRCHVCDAHAWVITNTEHCPSHRQPPDSYFDPNHPDP
ncbi:hypothetical protein PGT21_011646 [Puccinia graminis f. sp. tritici]|uniref:Secreted protein n=1 Tax=Puccinia graminis f. sp. tritici TaxID=56615 RepID=A0A5B0NIX1_PUCGR|nr:hypothetical protein PGT21_011646 [Puccinia graminis f. sp. tritici]